MERPGQDILISYFQGNCPPEEENAIKIYLAMNIDKEYVQACMQEAFPDLYQVRNEEISPAELDRAWNKLEAANTAYRPASVRIKPLVKWHAYAAIIAFALLSSIAVLILKNKWMVNEPSWTVVKAVNGGTKTITLADNSTVTLFPGSGLQIPRDFNQEDRRIRLTGRAFFHVSHNAAKPFYVSAQRLTTKVLGTSFEVNTSEIATESIITLHTGKVSISRSGKEITRLKPNQQFSFNKSTGKFSVTSVNAAATSTWLTGELQYEQATLRMITSDLEKWYGVKITTVYPEILDHKITISFSGLPITGVLHLLSRSANFNYNINGKHIIITERSMKTD